MVARRMMEAQKSAAGSACISGWISSAALMVPQGSVPIEIDALFTVVQERGRLVDVETPTIDTVLALAPVVVDWCRQPARWTRAAAGPRNDTASIALARFLGASLTSENRIDPTPGGRHAPRQSFSTWVRSTQRDAASGPENAHSLRAEREPG